jgi:hypothetical protein
MSTYRNLSDCEDVNSGFKTYYIRIEAHGATFFKFGKCTGSVKKRYSREATDVRIDVLQIWSHHSMEAAERHEVQLHRKHKGNRPFIGRCGPFKNGGNTECYSHDVLAGSPPPETYIARLFSVATGVGVDVEAFCDFDPRIPYYHLIGEVGYMNLVIGPGGHEEGGFVQVAELSSSKTVVLATRDFLNSIIIIGYSNPMKGFTKRVAMNAIESGISVSKFSDWKHMSFKGNGFRPIDVIR